MYTFHVFSSFYKSIINLTVVKVTIFKDVALREPVAIKSLVF